MPLPDAGRDRRVHKGLKARLGRRGSRDRLVLRERRVMLVLLDRKGNQVLLESKAPPVLPGRKGFKEPREKKVTKGTSDLLARKEKWDLQVHKGLLGQPVRKVPKD